ncbi:MAG: sigma-54-dependent Fis family transcriptional regulator, partial [Myxococcales bacterium]|nr:sigma-54-dependent Fis family transcriptional regulator [Myxococcales bacterium]
LRVLQEGEVDPVGADKPVKVDVRLVVATNQRLRELVDKGAFRQDLYYRLNVLEIRLPALRERSADIPLLTRHFVEMSARDRTLTIPDSVLTTLMNHDWPGNVRELQNTCERLTVLCPGDELRVEDLPPGVLDESSPPRTNLGEWMRQRPKGLSLFDVERLMIEHTLKELDGNLSGAARELGVPRHILAYRVEKFGILLDEIRSE